MLREEIVMVSTKYKTVDKKVRPTAGPLPTKIFNRKKEVSEHPELRKSMDIGHTFTEESMEESVKQLRIRVRKFLLPEEVT